ncbi:hypothetical protein PQZ08_02680 [Flavobacteriaceae bacterium]|nr:hypothetical protein [Flavobacteriaceae bacterium]MDC6478748.1 hypothetical protein [Flavobacteriaceae bacterium]
MSLLISFIKPLSACRENRLKGLKFIEENPEFTGELFELAHNEEAKREHIYAAWIWEFYILTKLDRYLVFFETSLFMLKKINHSSMRRSHSKTLWYFLKNKNTSDTLSKAQKERVISICLDWIITETKAAPINFCIKILQLLKTEFPEIQEYLEDLLLHSKREFSKGVFPVIRSVFKN